MEASDIGNFVSTYWSRPSGTSPWQQTGSYNDPYYIRRRSTTDSVFRRRPIDLFASGTARTVSSTLRQVGTVDFESGYSSNRTLGIPGFTLYSGYLGDLSSHPIDNGRVISAPSSSISREAMYNKIRSDIRGEAVNLANNLGEYRQTAQLFRDLAEVVATRGRSLIKRNKIGRAGRFGEARYADSLANAHLQFQYGIRPLASDLGLAIAQIQSGIQNPLELTGVVRRTDKVQQSGFKSANNTNVSLKAAVDREYVWVYRTSYRAKLNASNVMSTIVKSGLANPVSLAWELMPYSFVVDWWFNVGEVLSSLDNLLLVDSLMVIDSKSTRTAVGLTVRTNGVPGDTTKGQAVTRGSYSFEYKREDVRTSPTSISVIATPLFKPSLSYGHFLNGLALLQQLRGRSR